MFNTLYLSFIITNLHELTKPSQKLMEIDIFHKIKKH